MVHLCATSDDPFVSDVLRVDTIENLRLVGVPTSRAVILTEGGITPGDGLGLFFYWHSTSQKADNGGSVIQITGQSVGRWLKLPNGEITLTDYGADPTGTDSINASVALLVADYPSDDIELHLRGPTGETGFYRVDANLTFPRNVHLVFHDAILVLDDDVTLSIAGTIKAREHAQIFLNALEGQGTVEFDSTAGVKELYAEWWGAAGDGATNDTEPINAALVTATTVLGQVDIPVQLLSRVYKAHAVLPPYTSGDTFLKPRILKGMGHGTRLTAFSANAGPAISFDGRLGTKGVNAMIRLEDMFVSQGSTTNGTDTISLIGAINQGYLVSTTLGSQVVTLLAGDTTDLTAGESLTSDDAFAAGTLIQSVDAYNQLTLTTPALIASTTYDASRRMSTVSGDATITLTSGTTAGLSVGQLINGGNIPQNTTVGFITDATHFELGGGDLATGTETDLPLYVGAVELTIGVNSRIYGETKGLYVANNRFDSGGGRCLYVKRPLGFVNYDLQFESGQYGVAVEDGSNVRVYGMHGRINTCGGMLQLIRAAGCQFYGVRTEEGSFASDDPNLAVYYMEDCLDCTIDGGANEGSSSIRTVVYMLGTNPDDPAESGVCANNTLKNMNMASPSRTDMAGLNMIHMRGNVYGNEFEGRWGGTTSSFQLHGTVANGSAVITGIEDTTRVRGGYVATVSGTGIPAGALVKSVDSPTQITLDVPATADGSPITLSFANSGDDILVESITKRFTVNIGAGAGTFLAGEPVTGSVSGRTGTVESYVAGTGVLNLSKSDGTWVVGDVVVGGFSGASRTISGGVTVGANPHDTDMKFVLYANNAGSPVDSIIQAAHGINYSFKDERARLLSVRNGRSMNVNLQAMKSLEMLPDSVFTNTGATGTVTTDLPAARLGMQATFIKVANQGWRLNPLDNEYITGRLLTRNCTTSTATAVVTCAKGTAGIIEGSRIFGTGVTAGTTVLSVDSPTQFTMSAVGSANATNNLTIGGGAPGKLLTLTNVGDAVTLVADKQATVLIGNVTNTSAVVTALSSTAGLLRGQRVTGNGIPASTNILSVDSTTQITLTANATATKTDTALTFHGVWAITAFSGECSFEA